MGLTSCSTVEAPLPFAKGEALKLQEDEKRLWARAAEEQRTLNRSDHIYKDPLLTAYVEGLAQRVLPQEVKKKGLSIEVKVIKNPLVNAFTLPNGAIYIHTGFLAEMENEAQLVTVLAHEITHVTHRHTVQQLRNVKDTAAFLATLQVLAAPAGTYGLAPLLLGGLAAMASVSGYSQELEAEADREGLDLLVRAGYDPEEAVKLFERMQKHIKQEEIDEPFFFGSHPRLQERIDNYTQLLQEKYSTKKGDKGTERFIENIFPVFLDNALLDLSRGQFTLAEEAINRLLSLQPQNPKGHYYLGEVHRQRGEDEKGDREKAERAYRLASQYDPSYPDPHKGLGLAYYKQGLKNKAREAFEEYLRLAPNAADRAYIEQYLANLRSEGKE